MVRLRPVFVVPAETCAFLFLVRPLLNAAVVPVLGHAMSSSYQSAELETTSSGAGSS